MKDLPAQTYLGKLANKPAIAALTGLLATNPIIKMFASNFVPVLTYRDMRSNK